MARRRRKTSITRTLFRAWNTRRKAKARIRATERRVAAKRAQAAQKVIARESRTTAGELRRTGKVEWNAQGMPDSTVMEPVMKGGRHTGEWAPARQQPRKRANTVDRATGRPPAVPGMRAVRDGQGWAYEPIIRTSPVTHDGTGDPERFGRVPTYTNAGTATVKFDENGKPYIASRTSLAQSRAGNPLAQTTVCGAPTEDKTPCQRLGDCPVPAHKTWRARNGRS